jgi:hypothetical protein
MAVTQVLPLWLRAAVAAEEALTILLVLMADLQVDVLRTVGVEPKMQSQQLLQHKGTTAAQNSTVVLAVVAAAALPLQVVPADQTWAVMEEMVSLATLIRIFKNCATSVAVAAVAAIATMLEMAVAAVAAQEADEEMKFLLRD